MSRITDTVHACTQLISKESENWEIRSLSGLAIEQSCLMAAWRQDNAGIRALHLPRIENRDEQFCVWLDQMPPFSSSKPMQAYLTSEQPSRAFPLAPQFFSSIITTVAVALKGTAKKWNGVVAQLVERLVRNEKVAGSIPVGSTILRSEPRQSFRAKDGLYISIRLSHSGCPEPKSCTMAQSRSISPTSIACKGVSRSKAGLG